MIKCLHCRKPVHADGSAQVMDFFGITTWVHDEPWDPMSPWLCEPKMASPDFEAKDR